MYFKDNSKQSEIFMSVLCSKIRKTKVIKGVNMKIEIKEERYKQVKSFDFLFQN